MNILIWKLYHLLEVLLGWGMLLWFHFQVQNHHLSDPSGSYYTIWKQGAQLCGFSVCFVWCYVFFLFFSSWFSLFGDSRISVTVSGTFLHFFKCFPILVPFLASDSQQKRHFTLGTLESVEIGLKYFARVDFFLPGIPISNLIPEHKFVVPS